MYVDILWLILGFITGQIIVGYIRYKKAIKIKKEIKNLKEKNNETK